MKLKYLFGIFVLLLLTVAVLLLIMSSGRGGILLFVTEGIILFLLLFLTYFYKKVVRPLDSIANGMDLLREQDFSSRLKPVGQKEADRIVQVFNRMMLQLKDERLRLREQNHFLDLLIDVSPMGVIVLDFEEKISMMNKAAVQYLNIASAHDVKGCGIECVGTPLSKAIMSIPKGSSETIRLGDAMIYRCSRLSFVDRGFAHPFILVESLTSEVVKAEKKAYEKVIRMIAHEVNNTVGGVTSALETVKDMLGGMDDGADLQEVMTVCIERSMGMSRFITNFADVVKIPEPQLKPVRINDMVASCKMFMESLRMDKDITFRYELCAESPSASVDQVLMEQVMVNIVKNAVESISGKGNIVIRTSATAPMLEIADDGTPIPTDVETKLFTPFFSTKPSGQGIGLLFIREVLDRHHCTFSLRSYPDGWTRFSITFAR